MRAHRHGLVFIDGEADQNLGWGPKFSGERREYEVLSYPRSRLEGPTLTRPMDSWKTQTLIARLRKYEMMAPWVLNEAINKAAFETFVETRLTLILNESDVVILDNLSPHKSRRAAEVLHVKRCWFIFLPGSKASTLQGRCISF